MIGCVISLLSRSTATALGLSSFALGCLLVRPDFAAAQLRLKCEDALVQAHAGQQETPSSESEVNAQTAIAEKAIFPEEANPHQMALRAEEQAIETMAQVMVSGDQAKQEIRAWFSRIKAHQQAGQRLTVLEHTALLHLLRTGFLNDDPDPSLIQEIQICLVQSWKDLTGQEADLQAILETRLPRSVLRQASNEARQFHAAVFQSPRTRGSTQDASLGRDYLPMPRDVVAALGLVAISFNHTGGEVLGGAVMGYLLGAVAENLIHRYLAHPSGAMRRKFAAGGWLGKLFYRIADSHSGVHHGMTYRPKYTEQFESPEQQAQIDARLEKRAVEDIEAVKARRYGLIIESDAALRMTALVLPFSAVLSWMTGLDWAGSAALMASSLLFIPHVNFVHDYMHMSREKALQEANLPTKILLRSRYFAFVARNHFVHHESPNTNFNVLPGVDFLFGTFRKPTVEDLVKLRELGAIL